MTELRLQPFDSIATAAVRAELDRQLRGARLEKIQQPRQRELLLLFRKAGPWRLLLSAEGLFSRVHLTSHRAPAGKPGQAPPPFCLFLRKHLEGGRLVSVEQPGLERAIVMRFETFTQTGLNATRTLVAELGGTHSNLILLDEFDRVMAALRPVSETMSRVRQILPGLPYMPPPVDRNKLDPRQGSILTALDRAPPSTPSEEPADGTGRQAAPGSVARLDRAILGAFHSLSRLAIGQICTAAGIDPRRDIETLESEEIARLETAWSGAMAALARSDFEPRFVSGEAWDYALLPEPAVEAGRALRGEVSDLPAISALLDGYYGERQQREEIARRKTALLAEVEGRLNHLETAMRRAAEGIGSEAEAILCRMKGDLLLAHATNVPAGAQEVSLPDFETTEPVPITLDPELSAVQNARAYYRSYRKAQGALAAQGRLRAEAEFEREHWELVLAGLRAAETRQALDAAAEALTTVEPRKGAITTEGRPGRYRSADGLEILVGRNNRQNDLVTFKLARPDDWWFHVQKAPGAHVVVRSPTGSLPDRTTYQAALLAAWFSHSRRDTRVSVAFTRRKHVRKPAGSRPGFVNYDHERVVVVQPDMAEVEGIPRLE